VTRYLRMAATTADESMHRRHAVGCVVVRGGAVVARAANVHRKGQCAERRSLRRMRFDNGELYVARPGASGQLLCSKPCADCMKAIREAGVKKINYVDRNGAIVSELVI